jgi:hypothetical protein
MVRRPPQPDVAIVTGVQQAVDWLSQVVGQTRQGPSTTANGQADVAGEGGGS